MVQGEHHQRGLRAEDVLVDPPPEADLPADAGEHLRRRLRPRRVGVMRLDGHGLIENLDRHLAVLAGKQGESACLGLELERQCRAGTRRVPNSRCPPSSSPPCRPPTTSIRRRSAAPASRQRPTASLRPSLKAALDVDWDYPTGRQQALAAVLAALEVVEAFTAVRPALPQASAAHLKVARQVRDQDVETPPGEPARLRQEVARDRRISVTDPDMRHGRKSRSPWTSPPAGSPAPTR
jgi:hypothetical protein